MAPRTQIHITADEFDGRTIATLSNCRHCRWLDNSLNNILEGIQPGFLVIVTIGLQRVGVAVSLLICARNSEQVLHACDEKT